jgi:two-component system phosphate regulon response regulator PhoB
MKTILVVDDEPDIRESVKNILEKQNYRVFSAANGECCLNMLSEVKPDLILLDIRMSGIPAAEIVKQISDIKIVFMSVVLLSEARKQGLCQQKNVVDFIQKPFDANELISRINLILNEQ